MHARSIIYTFYIWGYGSTERLINFPKVSQLTSDRALFSSIMNRCYSQATPSSSPSYNFLHNLLCFMEGEQCFSTHIINRVFFTQALRALPGTMWLLCHPSAAGRSLAAARVSENSLPPLIWELSPPFHELTFSVARLEDFLYIIVWFCFLLVSLLSLTHLFLPLFVHLSSLSLLPFVRGTQRLLRTCSIASFAVLSKTLVICTS